MNREESQKTNIHLPVSLINLPQKDPNKPAHPRLPYISEKDPVNTDHEIPPSHPLPLIVDHLGLSQNLLYSQTILLIY